MIGGEWKRAGGGRQSPLLVRFRLLSHSRWRHIMVTKNVWHPTKSRLIYRDSTDPTPPPVENLSRACSGLMFASRKAQNQVLDLSVPKCSL
jgi:hypothetical protein